MADFRDKIPGYREAVSQEQLIRDSAFLGLTENIGDFEVVPLTLRHLLILRLMRSPFICGQPPGSVEDIIAFLWLLHPQYNAAGGLARRQLARRCTVYASPRLPLLHTRRAMARYEKRCKKVLLRVSELTGQIRAYLDEHLMDWPNGKGTSTSYYSDAASVCGALAREHHRTQEWVLEQPLKVILQYLNEIKEVHGKPLCNRSDKFVNKFLREHQDPLSLTGRMLAKAQDK